MPSVELCTEAEVAELVVTFYARVRDDAILGPIFERHVADWGLHMPKMVAFWPAALRGSKNYRHTLADPLPPPGGSASRLRPVTFGKRPAAASPDFRSGRQAPPASSGNANTVAAAQRSPA